VERAASRNNVRGQAYEPYSVEVDAAIDAAIAHAPGAGGDET
jgi:hypothetical protein